MPHPVLVPLVMKEYSYTSIPPMGHTACTESQCLYKGALYLLPIPKSSKLFSAGSPTKALPAFFISPGILN